MKKKWLLYLGFFIVLLSVFYYFVYTQIDFSESGLPVINNNIQSFSFLDQNGKIITEREVAGKVYVANYFFTTCQGICPKMNANMRRVYDAFKNEKDFMILSHTCMPEVDSVPLLKKYEYKMINGELDERKDGSYGIIAPIVSGLPVQNTNWYFLTGSKISLYDLARHSYLIDKDETDTAENIKNQFIHTQLFALVDKQQRVRGIYDGLKEDEIQKLITDIKSLLKEKAPKQNFLSN
ncbi:MAG TPA: SCO family protein [Ferruginibacter sp.]|jgi:protein SCO1/2|nr:SCO family protein [Ferruginibacter sp.]